MALDRTLSAFVASLLHDVLHYDGRLWRTLPLLALRPGVLTRRYIDGRRTRYVGPNVVFFGTAFVMFLSFNLIPDGLAAPAPCDAPAASAIQRTGAAVRTDLENLGPSVEPLLPEVVPGSAVPAVQWLERHAPGPLLARLEAALVNPEMAVSSVKHHAHTLGFILVPLSLPALWLLVGRRAGVQPYDLVVFALYSIGFMSLLLTFVTLVAGLGVSGLPAAVGLLLAVPPLHFFFHLRDSFDLDSVAAAWRTVALSAVAVMSLLCFTALVLAWGLLI